MTRNVPFDPAIGKHIRPEFFLDNLILPLRKDADGTVTLAVAQPEDVLAVDMLSAYLEAPVRVVRKSAAEIRQGLMHRETLLRKGREFLRNAAAETSQKQDKTELLVSHSEESRIITLVNTILAEAVERRASDVHLEPRQNGLRVRYRIDGLLRETMHPPEQMKAHIISRIKVMAGMDISMRNAPQDGNMSVTVGGNPVDIRVSSVPTPTGERLVLRLLGRSRELTTLSGLGMNPDMQRQLDEILSMSQGLIIASGPTGSGKTTTLYACLHRIDAEVRNVITIEDPVEYRIPGISQMQVSGSGMGFSSGLRSMLRQDPDVIMVGEIRDGETASIALRAALTGHLILTTIHTSSAEGAVIRLLDLGVDPALISETLTAVLDQRLFRLVCPYCHAGETGEGTGCEHCDFTGFKGRTALFRLLRITDPFRKMIRERNLQALKQAHGDLMSYPSQARELIAAGVTTEAEVRRVLEGSQME